MSVEVKIKSNYKNSAKTFEMVKQEISKRWGKSAAEEYDPFNDCMTYKGWLKNNYIVRPGEKSIKSMTMVEVKNEKGEVVRKYPKTVHLFHYLQVRALRTDI